MNYDVSTAKNLLLLASSQEDQQKWVSRLMKKIPKKPPAPDAPHRSSPRVPSKVQSSQSMRRPSRQIPSGKPRWGISLDMLIFMQNSGNHVAVSSSILCFYVKVYAVSVQIHCPDCYSSVSVSRVRGLNKGLVHIHTWPEPFRPVCSKMKTVIIYSTSHHSCMSQKEKLSRMPNPLIHTIQNYCISVACLKMEQSTFEVVLELNLV